MEGVGFAARSRRMEGKAWRGTMMGIEEEGKSSEDACVVNCRKFSTTMPTYFVYNVKGGGLWLRHHSPTAIVFALQIWTLLVFPP